MPQSRILLGVIGRPHGVRGLVRVTSHTEDPADLTAYGPLTDAQGRRFVLRWRGEGLVEVTERIGDKAVKVADRNAAEKLTNTRLYIDRAQLPPPAEDEFYFADLIGLAAVDRAGTALGRVAAVHEYGAGASLEIERDNAAPLLVPFTRTAVPAVDLAAGRITVEAPTEIDLARAAEESPPPSLAPRGAARSRAGEGHATAHDRQPSPPPGALRAPRRSASRLAPASRNGESRGAP